MVINQWQPTPVLLPGKSHGWRSLVGCSPWGREESDMTEQLHFHFPLSTFHFHALEKETATHSSILAWRISGTGEPGGLPSLGSHRVGHDWSDLAAAAASDWIASPTQWTWGWANSGRWWRTGKPGMLQSMGSQRVGHNWATKQQQIIWFYGYFNLILKT